MVRRDPQALRQKLDHLSEALIQGSLVRPAEFEVYLGESGIFCRQTVENPVEIPVGSGAVAELAA